MADADGRDAQLLKDTVREAGELAHSMFRTELKNWIKGASSPVSEADIAVNDLLEARLRSATPDYGWLSEESADDEKRLAKKLVWIVDPIDGTRGYLAGREDWCVSVALVEDTAPLLAAVFAPVTNEFFFAARGQGATRNETPISVTGGTALDFARVAAWLTPRAGSRVSAAQRYFDFARGGRRRWPCRGANVRTASSTAPAASRIAVGSYPLSLARCITSSSVRS